MRLTPVPHRNGAILDAAMPVPEGVRTVPALAELLRAAESGGSAAMRDLLVRVRRREDLRWLLEVTQWLVEGGRSPIVLTSVRLPRGLFDALTHMGVPVGFVLATGRVRRAVAGGGGALVRPAGASPGSATSRVDDPSLEGTMFAPAAPAFGGAPISYASRGVSPADEGVVARAISPTRSVGALALRVSAPTERVGTPAANDPRMVRLPGVGEISGATARAASAAALASSDPGLVASARSGAEVVAPAPSGHGGVMPAPTGRGGAGSAEASGVASGVSMGPNRVLLGDCFDDPEDLLCQLAAARHAGAMVFAVVRGAAGDDHGVVELGLQASAAAAVHVNIELHAAAAVARAAESRVPTLEVLGRERGHGSPAATRQRRERLLRTTRLRAVEVAREALEEAARRAGVCVQRVYRPDRAPVAQGAVAAHELRLFQS